MLIDIFTYTDANGIEALIEAARNAHLDGIAVTDRGSSSRVREYADIAKRAGMFVAFGVEIETDGGRVTAYPASIDDEFAAEGWKNLGEKPAAESVLEYFHERGGVVVARDVYNRGEGLRDRIYSARDSQGRGFDAVDTLAAYRRRIDNELSIEAQQVLGAPACAGSGVSENIEEIGHCATLFAGGIADQAAFVAALRGPLHWACSLWALGDACPMGAAPREDDRDDRRGGRRDDRRDDHRGGRRDDHRGGRRDDRRDARGDDRRGGHRDDRRHGDDRGERRGSGRGGDERRGSGRGGDRRRSDRGPRR